MPSVRPAGGSLLDESHPLRGGALEALGLRLLAGRTVTEDDRSDTQPVVVVSESLADTLWPGEDPLGRRLRNWVPPDADPADFPYYTVVGVVADARLAGRTGVGIPTPNDAFFAHAQRRHESTRQLAVVLVTAGDPAAVASAVPGAVADVDPDLAAYEIHPLAEVVAREEELPRFTASLMAAFGALSLFLAALGIYGVLSQAVTVRRPEIGLRTALGAPSSSLVQLFVGHGLRLALLGIGIGLAAALGLARFVSSLLFGVSATDPTSLLVAAGILLLSALLAAYLPTRRALRVDPRTALEAG
jgi:hypothetical protein